MVIKIQMSKFHNRRAFSQKHY